MNVASAANKVIITRKYILSFLGLAPEEKEQSAVLAEIHRAQDYENLAKICLEKHQYVPYFAFWQYLLIYIWHIFSLQATVSIGISSQSKLTLVKVFITL
jgi:hypothetical protein